MTVDSEERVNEEKPRFRHDMSSFYESFNSRALNQAGGHGELLELDRWIAIFTPYVPEAMPLRRDMSHHLRRYFTMRRLSFPETTGARSENDVWTMLYQAEVNDTMNVDGRQTFRNDVRDTIRLSRGQRSAAAVPVHLVAAHIAWKSYAEAAVCGLKGSILIFRWMGSQAGKVAIDIHDYKEAYNLLAQLKRLRLEIRTAYTTRTVEEKILLQSLFFCAYAVAHERMPLEQAERYIRSIVETMQWSLIDTHIDPAWFGMDYKATDAFMKEFVSTYGAAISILETPMEKFLPSLILPGLLLDPKTMEALPPMIRYPYSMYRIPKEEWINGIGGDLHLEPYMNYPYRASPQESGLSLAFSEFGVGKSIAGMGIVGTAIEDGAIALVMKGDDTNQSCYWMLPAVGPFYNEHGRVDHEIEERLVQMQVQPHPWPTMILDIIGPGDEELLKRVPLTKYDRVIRVEDTLNFHFSFERIIEEFWKVHAAFPYPTGTLDQPWSPDSPLKPAGGAIVVRYLNRKLEGGSVNKELQIAAVLMNLFNFWREYNSTQPILQYWDEIKESATRNIMGGQAGQDTSRMGGLLDQTFISARRLNFSIIGNTADPSGVLAQALKHATNVMIKDIASAELDLLFDVHSESRLQLNDRSEADIVRRIVDRNELEGTRLWLHWNRRKRAFDLVSVCPIPVMVQVPARSLHDTIEHVEEVTGQSYLLGPDADLAEIELPIASAGRTAKRRRGQRVHLEMTPEAILGQQELQV